LGGVQPEAHQNIPCFARINEALPCKRGKNLVAPPVKGGQGPGPAQPPAAAQVSYKAVICLAGGFSHDQPYHLESIYLILKLIL
jgi:hypothetical protein